MTNEIVFAKGRKLEKEVVRSGVKELQLTPWQYAALYNPYTHFAMLCGIAVGKTFTGSHFSINHIIDYPQLTGFIGTNNYDQMSHATLKELFYWLDTYDFEYVFDRRPPSHWPPALRLKSNNNTISVKNGEYTTTIFTRVLSDPHALRGPEFSWYWLDETSDTKRDAHEVVLSRLRESNYIKGLITTTTRGEDWVHDRFVLGPRPTYGSLHIKTIESVRYGIITKSFYDALRASYSELMAKQELDAEHVNVQGGRAYYSSGDYNKMPCSPWGDMFPDSSRPIILACDFNFSPAPCVWVVGQEGPYTRGKDYSQHIHWFEEISETQISSEEMAARVALKYPDCFIQVYGDASGKRGTTSNAGVTDYDQIMLVFDRYNIHYSLHVPESNPLVRDRVERVNAALRNSLGETFMTYDASRCPLLHDDLKNVGYKPTGKLDDGGKVQRTHASDAIGYYVYQIYRRDIASTTVSFGRDRFANR